MILQGNWMFSSIYRSFFTHLTLSVSFSNCKILWLLDSWYLLRCIFLKYWSMSILNICFDISVGICFFCCPLEKIIILWRNTWIMVLRCLTSFLLMALFVAFRSDVWLLTSKGKGYAVVVVMEFLGYGKQPSIFNLYHIFHRSFNGEKWLHVDGVIRQSYINLGVCKLFEALEMNPRILNGG